MHSPTTSNRTGTMETSIRISAPLWALFLMVACLSAPIVQSKNHVLRQNSKEIALKRKNLHTAKARNAKRHLQEFAFDDDLLFGDDLLPFDDDLIDDGAVMDFLFDLLQDENFTQCELLILEMDFDDFSLYDDANLKFADSMTLTESEEELFASFDFNETARAELEATCDELGGYFLTQEAPLQCTITVANETGTFEYSGDAACYPDFDPCRNFDYFGLVAATFENLIGAECEATEDFAFLVTAPPQSQITFEDLTVSTAGAAPGEAIEEPPAINYIKSNIRRPNSGTTLAPKSF